MKIAEYKQIDTKVVTNTIMVDDYDTETGENIGSHEETVTKEVPVMGVVYRDATTEEIAEAEREAAEMPPPEPTLEEQLADLADLVGVLAEVTFG